MKKAAIFIIVIILLGCIACKKKTGTEAEVEVIDGVTFIHNPEKPINPDRTVSFEVELSIGGEDEDGNALLYEPSLILVDGKGQIYISDRQDQSIKIFNQQGSFIRSVGSKGSGPGEFQFIRSMDLLPDERLIVLDWRSRRTSIFSTTGDFQKSYQWKTFHNDILLTTNTTCTILENIYGEKTQIFVKSFDLSGEELFSFGEFTPPGFKEFRRKEATISIAIPYHPHSRFAGDQQLQRLYHCLNNQYKIEMYDQNGKLIRVIDRPYVPVPFTEKDKKEYYGHFDESPNRMGADLAREVELPKVKTITEHMLVDDIGNLWVQTHEIEEREGTKFTAYDIFSKDGHYTARIWSDIRPWIFAKGKMYSIITDEDTGLQSVKRYKVNWNKK